MERNRAEGPSNGQRQIVTADTNQFINISARVDAQSARRKDRLASSPPFEPSVSLDSGLQNSRRLCNDGELTKWT